VLQTLENSLFLRPFFRLVSAFENKILFNKDSNFASLALKINGSFPRFVDFVVSEFSACGSALVEPCYVDLHWRRIVDRCSFCEIDFDVIGFVETFSEDVQYILEKTNLSYLVEEKHIHKKNSVPHDEKRGLKYFAQLTSEQRERLHEIYYLDFAMFGYDPKPYLETK
jgi:hypothetical protein